MPRAKRPLSEVDPNASTNTAPHKSAKIETAKPTLKAEDGKKGRIRTGSMNHTVPSRSDLPASSTSRKWSASGTVFHGTKAEQLEEEQEVQKEEIEYRNKDNSKLRRLLSERSLYTSGTREELIARLENSSIDYNELSSTRITEMLRDRHVTMSGQGAKEYKIQRLRINDKVERDTGNSNEAYLYGHLSAMEFILGQHWAKKGQETDYSTMKPAKLSALLARRNLSQNGSQSTLIKRLQKDDRKTNEKCIKHAQTKHDEFKWELESKTGRSINASQVMKRENTQDSLEMKILQEAEAERPVPKPVCDYNWKDSHWADRTEREISEICSRRGMPGYGPKAAMLKWLDTGNVDYEDMYIGGLTSICRERGVKYKDNDKKVGLIRRLREADEAE